MTSRRVFAECSSDLISPTVPGSRKIACLLSTPPPRLLPIHLTPIHLQQLPQALSSPAVSPILPLYSTLPARSLFTCNSPHRPSSWNSAASFLNSFSCCDQRGASACMIM